MPETEDPEWIKVLNSIQNHGYVSSAEIEDGEAVIKFIGGFSTNKHYTVRIPLDEVDVTTPQG